MSDYVRLLNKNPELAKESNEVSQNTCKLTEELKKLIPKDRHELIDDLIGSVIAETAIETRVAFKEGVVLGVTGLNYLSEVGQEIRFI